MSLKNLFLCALLQFAQLPSTAMAQDIPGGMGPFDKYPGQDTPDTIIHIPFYPIGGGVNHAPTQTYFGLVLYWNNYIFFNVPLNTLFSYSICSNFNTSVLRGNSTSSTIIEISSLPPGHYTLCLYINNECLEGEFEKE